MYELFYTGKFKKDYKLCIKRGLDPKRLEKVISLLEVEGDLPDEYKPHKLSGNYKGLWECHIQPDWLLIWAKEESIKLIKLTRTGTHSDLF
jgi:mRNA interferase YafQ